MRRTVQRFRLNKTNTLSRMETNFRVPLSIMEYMFGTAVKGEFDVFDLSFA